MKHLKVGDSVPQWSGSNGKGEILNWEQFKGKKTAIYFYPKDSTPGCTVQACNLRDNLAVLEKNGIHIIGVSADSSSSHEKFSAKQNLKFPLIADENREMIELFGVWGEKKFMGKTYDGIHRTTFLINEKGQIVDIIEKPKTKAHAEEILESFKNSSTT